MHRLLSYSYVAAESFYVRPNYEEMLNQIVGSTLVIKENLFEGEWVDYELFFSSAGVRLGN